MKCKLENFLTSEATYNESRPSPRNSQNIKYLTHNTTWQLQHLKFVRMDARLWAVWLYPGCVRGESLTRPLSGHKNVRRPAGGRQSSELLHYTSINIVMLCILAVQAQAAKSLHHSSHITPRRAQESLKRTFVKISQSRMCLLLSAFTFMTQLKYFAKRKRKTKHGK